MMNAIETVKHEICKIYSYSISNRLSEPALTIFIYCRLGSSADRFGYVGAGSRTPPGSPHARILAITTPMVKWFAVLRAGPYHKRAKFVRIDL